VGNILHLRLDPQNHSQGQNGFHDVNYSKRKRGGPGFGHALANLQKGKQDMMAWRVRHIGQYP
jgi:hypothetical protein